MFTKISEMDEEMLSGKSALAFFAKDDDTLVRGLTCYAKHTKKKHPSVQTDNGLGLALWAGKWKRETELRYANKFTAGLATVGGNILEFGKRSLAELIITLETLDRADVGRLNRAMMEKQSRRELQDTFNIDGRYTNFKQAMELLGRDGRMVREGAFVYMCRSVDMPANINCGKMQNQLGSLMTFSALAVKTRQLFH